MVLVFSPFDHPKLHFVLSEIFVRRCKMPFQITCDDAFFIQTANPLKINYSREPLPGIPVYQSGWLAHEGLDPHFKPAYALQSGLPCLFPETGNKRFDLFAACFWLLSRYEEYQEFRGDAYGRFSLKDSCLPDDWCAEPFLDIHIRNFLHELGLQPKNEFRIIPTADIDIAFKFLGRPPQLRFAGFIRDLLLSRNNLAERWHMRIRKHDPYDVYNWLCARFRNFPDARIFWQMNRSRNGKDRQVNIRHRLFVQRLKTCVAQVKPGIHPSWESKTNAAQLHKEQTELERIIGQQVRDSRQHFLAFSFPETFRNLVQSGITQDYSLGWPERAGFRAATSWPFAFYDVLRDKQEALGFIPSCAMDVTLKDYMNLNAADAILLGNELKEKARREGGVFCFIVHNESMSETGSWKGWQKVAEAWMA
ncbi:MAG: hypothetical protein RLZZ370_1138 [Bacteroidota bacterium]